MNNHKIKWKTKWFFGNANIAGPMLQSEESGCVSPAKSRYDTYHDTEATIRYVSRYRGHDTGLH